MTVIEIASIISSTAVALTFILFSWQLYLTRKEDRYDAYERINSQWITHMSRILLDSSLEKIWDKIDETRKSEFDYENKNDRLAWNIMTKKEKKCYRYVRISLEIFEISFNFQTTHIVHKRFKEKWKGQIISFLGSDYFLYAFNDTKPRLDPSFSKYVENIIEECSKQKKSMAFGNTVND